MNRAAFIFVGSVFLILIAFGVDYFSPHPNPLPQGERESVDVSRIWSRGATGDAAENAAHHFKKHGHEFGFKTEAEYVAAAVAFTTNPPQQVMQNVQRDGDVAFYNPKTAEYAVKSKRGFIRTYFKLNPRIHGYKTNTDYFNAQAKVGNPPPANDNHRQSSVE